VHIPVKVAMHSGGKVATCSGIKVATLGAKRRWRLQIFDE